MSYIRLYEDLKKAYQLGQARTELPEYGLCMQKIPFISQSELVFTRDKDYYMPDFMRDWQEQGKGARFAGLEELICIGDADIEENKFFDYTLISPLGCEKADEILIFFHGLNEKDWSKYLPWAANMCLRSGKSVILFPLAFHMNRGARAWGNTRAMNQVSAERQQLFEGLKENSFTNAAMSTRLHFAPGRFFLSGLQTYNDIIQLTQYIRLGNHPHISENATIDFFGYSAGAFLAAIILMANRNRLFDDSRALFLCGGSLLSLMFLSSKYIMDSEAHERIHQYYVDHFEEELKKDTKLRNLFESAKNGGAFFRSMLSEQNPADNQLREEGLRRVASRILSVSMEKDDIIPFSSIKKTLQGRKGDIPVECVCYAPDYAYSHMNPFPYLPKTEEAVSQQLDEVLAKMCTHLQRAPKEKAVRSSLSEVFQTPGVVPPKKSA